MTTRCRFENNIKKIQKTRRKGVDCDRVAYDGENCWVLVRMVMNIRFR